MIDHRTAEIALWVWCAIALGYALWRSRGVAGQDPIRPSGPSRLV